MRGRTRAEYVRDKIVYHLVRFSRAAILLEVARELAADDARGGTFGTMFMCGRSLARHRGPLWFRAVG
jgi:hypothetical protein